MTINAIEDTSLSDSIGILTEVVDYSASIKELIVKGNYDNIDERIHKVLFKVSTKTGKFNLPINVVHTESPAITENIAIKLQEKKLRHASVEEILTFGFTYPDMQRKFIILALSATCSIGKNKYALFLHGNENKRNLSLCPMKERWSEKCRFLVFPTDPNNDFKMSQVISCKR